MFQERWPGSCLGIIRVSHCQHLNANSFHPLGPSAANMRILLLIDDYYPSTKSGPKLIHDLGVELTAQGHRVTIASPSGAIQRPVEVSVEDGMEVVRIKTGRLKGIDVIRRAWNEIWLSSTMWQRGKKFFRRNPCDVIVFYSPTIFFGQLVRKLKSVWQCPSYLVLRDIFPKWAIDAGVMKKGLVYEYFRRKELQQYAAAD